jgi:hypothetical protein
VISKNDCHERQKNGVNSPGYEFSYANVYEFSRYEFSKYESKIKINKNKYKKYNKHRRKIQWDALKVSGPVVLVSLAEDVAVMMAVAVDVATAGAEAGGAEAEAADAMMTADVDVKNEHLGF